MNKKATHAIIILFILTFIFTLGVHAENIFTDAVKASGEGNVNALITHCGDIITGETDTGTMSKAYTMLAIGYTLQGGKDAKDRCAGLIDLVPDDVSKTPSLPVIRLLAGEIKSDQLSKEVSAAPQDWKAVAALAMYINGVREKADLKELYNYTKQYQDNIIGLPKDDWAAVWNPRLIQWHSWVQSGKGEKDKLEKLIADNGAKVLTKTTEDQDKKRTEAVSAVIRLYLQNDIAQAKEAAVKEKTTYSATDAPLYVVLDYLSGNDMITPEKIFAATSSKASVWALATVAMFAKSLADAKEPNKQKLYYYIDNYDGNFKFLTKFPEVTVWKPNVDRWRKWCDSGFKADAVSGLEPLVIAKSKTAVQAVANKEAGKDITLMELEEFETGREEKYKGRQRPDSMEFNDDVFKKYLNKLPEKLQATEKLRYTTIKGIKAYIIRVLERSPYDKGLILKDKKISHGVIYMANENLLRFKKSTKSKKGTSYKWEELAFEQYPAFMEYFANRRLGISGAAQMTKAKLKEGAAMDFLGMAILCDWFGRYGDALNYAKRAVEIHPESKEQVSRMMLE